MNIKRYLSERKYKNEKVKYYPMTSAGYIRMKKDEQVDVVINKMEFIVNAGTYLILALLFMKGTIGIGFFKSLIFEKISGELLNMLLR